jgi:probable lipoprotein (TIGR04455 family)
MTWKGPVCRTPWALILLLALGGCAVRSVFVKPDYATTERLTLKRIGVYATPLRNAPPQAAQLLARIARRYILQHKDYLAQRDGVIETSASWRGKCDQPVHGIVTVAVNALKLTEKSLTLDASMTLRRCTTGTTIWRVEIRDTNDRQDADLAQLAKVYRAEFGEVADSYAAPFFIAIKSAFKSMPSPQLTEEEVMEKISLDE